MNARAWVLAFWLASVATSVAAGPVQLDRPAVPELQYLQVVNDAAPADDPRIVFLLMAHYTSAQRTGEGIAHFESLLQRFGNSANASQRAVYLSALGLLKANHAGKVPFFSRIGWVAETKRVFAAAKQATPAPLFIARWGHGIFQAQVPSLLRDDEVAIADLEWCIAHPDEAPSPGFLREAYFHLAKLLRERDTSDARAADFLRLSGYASFEKTEFLTTSLSTNPRDGATFYPPQIRELVPGTVWALSGFEFTEFYFIRSADGKELIAIDAGTRDDSALKAYEALRAFAGNLPPLTTVLVTHAHYDHVGGHRAFRSLNPGVKFIGRENFEVEQHSMRSAPPIGPYFFGEKFSMDAVLGYKPDVQVDRPTTLIVGGTELRLIPVGGGETLDAMFVHLPKDGLLFVGDFIMPYFGAPYVEEGNIEGLFAAMDVVRDLAPRQVLHGHTPLTQMFTVKVLAQLQPSLRWLRSEIGALVRAGTPRSLVHDRNLIPPFIGDVKDAQLQYLVVRENFINRIYDQLTGYWQPVVEGLDHLGPRDHAYALLTYFGATESGLVDILDKMLRNGDLTLASRTADQAVIAFPDSDGVRARRIQAYERLKEKYQETDPFKYFIYSEQIKRETKGAPSVRTTQ